MGAMPANQVFGGFVRRLGLALGLLRAGLGVVAITAPAVVARPWVGEDAELPAARLLGRALGGRDLALGAGTALAMGSSGGDRWLQAGLVADATDVVVTLLHFSALPRRGRWLVLGAAGSGAALGAVLTRAAAGGPGSAPGRR